MQSSDATPRSLAKGRYEIRAVIGRGASGEVLRVLDRERQRNVALKRLLRVDAQDAFLIKREFRTLADAKHPNVVELYDLWSEGGKLFYTMELIRGSDVVSFVAEPHGAANPFERVARVSRLLPQLAAGLRALHSQGVLHRDVKPHNVLVEPGTDGAVPRLVLLDFGVLATATPDARDAASNRDLVGAVAYMAPEQLWLGKAGEASDWYAAGVLLYEALTGRLPYEGNPRDIAAAKRTKPVPPLDRERIPAWLAELVENLCAAKPADRPSHGDVIAILARAGATAAGDDVHHSALPTVRRVGAWSADVRAQDPFHGRDRELRILDDAFARGRASGRMLVCVSGESGIGKSELVLRALDDVERAERAIVFRGRCHPHESIPYKALDQIVDDLSRQLMIDARATTHVGPRRLGALTRLFPVLARVKAVAERCEDVSQLEPGILREEGAHGLRDLLSAIAVERPVILWIDDAQWGDADSATVLQIVLDPAARTPESPISLALSYRPEAERSSPVVRTLLEDPSARAGESWVALSLQPLAGEAAARLAADLLRARGVENAVTIAAIARDSGGSPFFIGELARSDTDLFAAGASTARAERTLGVAGVVRKRFDRLRGGAREILELVALAGAPLGESLALRAAGLDRTGAGDVDDLERLCLLRTYETAEQRMLQPYHDRIAEAVRDALGAPRQRALHGAIAAALEEQPDAEPELLVFHYRGAEATALAAHHAQRAARRAYDALAFDRAAEMFRFAALHTDEDAARAALWAGLAESLASAGRGEDAARAFETAADAVMDGSADVQALDYRRRAAEQLLKCGHVEGGITRMRDVLAFFHERLPETPGEGIRSLLLQRSRLLLRGLRFEQNTSARLRPYEAARLDAMWATSISVSMVNPTLSVALSTRHLIDVLDSGDKPRICQALAAEAAWRTSFGRRYRRQALRILDTARELARDLGTPYERAWASMAEGVMHWQSGRWGEAITPLESALAIYRTECRGVFFEIAIVHMYLYASLALAGEIARLRTTVLDETAVHERRNDRFALHGALLGESVLGWLAGSDAASVVARADEVISEWPAGSFLMQHYHHLTTTVQAEIFLGNGASAWQRLTAAWPHLSRAGFLNLDCPSLGLRFLCARAALALLAASSAPPDRRAILHRARREARRIEHSRLPAAAAFGAIVRAGIAAATGAFDLCATELTAARAAARLAHMPLHAAAAAIALGRVHGGDDAKTSADEGCAWMAAQQIADPERMSAMLVPLPAVREDAT